MGEAYPPQMNSKLVSLLVDPRFGDRDRVSALALRLTAERSAHGGKDSPPPPKSESSITTAHLLSSSLFNLSHATQHANKL